MCGQGSFERTILYTQTEIAHRLNISQKSVSKIKKQLKLMVYMNPSVSEDLGGWNLKNHVKIWFELFFIHL